MIHSLKRFLSMMRRTAEAAPAANDVLTYQGNNQIQWRDPSAGAWIDHGGLGGLADDDHAQYLLLAGRSGGQTVYGGTDGGDDLILYSTSNATLGVIDIQSDVKTDRWLDSTTNLFIGEGVVGSGNLAHGAGQEGWYNIGIGYTALEDITTGEFNTAVGFGALGNLTTGHRNFGLGAWAGNNLTDGTYNLFIGTNAGSGCVSGDSNVCIGYRAGYLNVGSFSISIGHQAGQGTAGQTADHSTFIGYLSGRDISTGDRNTALGAFTSTFNQTGSDNVCIGYGAGYGVTGNSNQRNVFIGKDSAIAVTTGSNNVCVGYEAGEDITTGAGNVCIGYMAGETNLVGDSNELWIANSNTATPLIYGEFDTGFIKINNHIYLLERSSDPAQPAEGECVIWMSDGTGKGDDGDVLIASQAGGATKYGTLFDHSGGAAW